MFRTDQKFLIFSPHISQAMCQGIFDNRLDTDTRHRVLEGVAVYLIIIGNTRAISHIHDVEVISHMRHFILQSGKFIRHIQAVTENRGQRTAHSTYHRTVLCVCDATHGIQRIIKEMRIDLRLKHFIFRTLYQHLVL